MPNAEYVGSGIVVHGTSAHFRSVEAVVRDAGFFSPEDIIIWNDKDRWKIGTY